MTIQQSPKEKAASLELIGALKEVLQAFASGEHYEVRNPYSRPYVKRAFKAIAAFEDTFGEFRCVVCGKHHFNEFSVTCGPCSEERESGTLELPIEYRD